MNTDLFAKTKLEIVVKVDYNNNRNKISSSLVVPTN